MMKASIAFLTPPRGKGETKLVAEDQGLLRLTWRLRDLRCHQTEYFHRCFTSNLPIFHFFPVNYLAAF